MLYIGTSGYSYSDWRGVFYPDTTKPPDYLRFYAENFNFTELNFSYYRMPSSQQLESMAEKVPEGFLFAIKAHQSMTHLRDTDWRSESQHFLEALRPLSERSSLAGVLIQFPYSFHYTPENRQYLANLLDVLGIQRCFIEFRNSEWQREQVLRGIRERNAVPVISDNPRLKGLPLFQPEADQETVYYRFHGRNKANWWTGDSSSRYDYLYSNRELKQLSEQIEASGKRPKQLFAAFNNHRRAQAVKNAEFFASLFP